MSHRQLILLLLALMVLPVVCTAAECLECHTTSVFKVMHKDFYDHAEGFAESVHGKPGYTCAVCHGGDPMAKNKDDGHHGMHRMEDERINQVCGGCHPDDLALFAGSRHVRDTKDRNLAPHCASCHGSMAMDVINVSRVIGRCRVCHGGDDDEMLNLAGEVLSRSIAVRGYEAYIVSMSGDKGQVGEVIAASDRLADHWHRLDLGAADNESSALLRVLRNAKKKIQGEE
jgi:cytochrome c1